MAETSKNLTMVEGRRERRRKIWRLTYKKLEGKKEDMRKTKILKKESPGMIKGSKLRKGRKLFIPKMSTAMISSLSGMRRS